MLNSLETLSKIHAPKERLSSEIWVIICNDILSHVNHLSYTMQEGNYRDFPRGFMRFSPIIMANLSKITNKVDLSITPSQMNWFTIKQKFDSHNLISHTYFTEPINNIQNIYGTVVDVAYRDENNDGK